VLRLLLRRLLVPPELQVLVLLVLQQLVKGPARGSAPAS
jgi:hypothetical protein